MHNDMKRKKILEKYYVKNLFCLTVRYKNAGRFGFSKD